jgi:hypothetical protein
VEFIVGKILIDSEFGKGSKFSFTIAKFKRSNAPVTVEGDIYQEVE